MADSLRETARKDVDFHLHSFTDPYQHLLHGPSVITRGEGVYLFDDRGNRYLDAMSSLWCCTLGYSEPRLIAAANEQMSKLPYCHTFRGRTHEKLAELAEQLVDLAAPLRMTQAYFAGSGSEANESAIKLAWNYHRANGNPGKTGIISRHNAYHGSTVFSSWLSGMDTMHRYSTPPSDNVIFVDCPHYYSLGREGESPKAFSTRLADHLESTILERGPETIAAFIAEPIMGVGGVIVPPADYFEKIQTVLKKYDVLMIADEVICGFGRTGNQFGSITLGVTPDILTVAKGLSSAYFPISAALVTSDMAGALFSEGKKHGVFSHGFTYSGHPVGAAVALEALQIYREREVIRHVNAVSGNLQDGLRRLAGYPIVGDVRGLGLMAAVQLVADQERKQPFPAELKVGNRVVENAEKRGLFVRAVGDTILFAPPLIIQRSELSEILQRFEDALKTTVSSLPG